MKFLSDILAKAGLTVDGVVTLNNTATGQTPAANDNSTKLATTAWVRGFVTPYTLPIASGTTLGGIKIGSGLSIDGTGIVSVAASGVGAIRALQQITATAGQTVFTVSGGYTPGLIDVFLNGVLVTPNAIDISNGNTFTLADAAVAGDLLDIFVYNPIYNGFISSTDQVPEGSTNLYYTNVRARAAITLTVTGTSGASTYNSSTGVLNIPTYTLAGLGGVPTGRIITIDGVAYDLSTDRTWNILPTGGAAGDILAKNSATNYDVAWIPNYTSSVKHTVKAAVALTKGQAVYVSSADGTNMIVSKASNAAESTSSKTLGLIAQDLAINGQGFVVTEGLLAGLDTSTATAGDPVWLGTNGNLIFGLVNKPTAPAHLVFIGIVTRVQQNNGEIFVKVQNGFELDELHNLSVASPSDGDMIKYVASTGLWTKIAATTTNITEGTNLYYTNARARAAISVTGSGSYDSATGVITVTGGVTSVNTLTGAVTLTTSNIAEGTNLYYTDARVNTYLTTNNYATQSYVGTAIANLVASAPATLDTLNELATALGNDPNFATTVSTSIGTKVPQTRTITINGTAYDLSADRSWTIASGVTSFNTRTGAITPATGDYTTAQVTESGNLYFTNTRARASISLTTTGTSGAATYDNTTGILNIPQYQGGVTSFNTRTGAITLTSTDVTDALGFTPASSVSSSSRTIQTFVATANQTTFTVTGGYVVGLVDIYINGVKISTSDFTATNGSTIVLATGTGVGNIVEVVRYNTAFTATNALRQVTYFTATAGQTTFTVTYNPGLVDVFYNGSKLAASDYTATNGTSVVLGFSATLNDSIEVVAYSYAVGAYTGQAQLNGTGFVKVSGTTVSYDNSTYLTTSSAASTYQTILTNPVTGTGTTNYLPKFTGTSTIGNSLVYDNGTNVGIGTATPYSATNYKFLTIDGTNGSGFVTRVSSINSFLTYSNSGGTTLSEQRALPIVFETTGTSRMTLDASGNLGLGVTPSAWSNSGNLDLQDVYLSLSSQGAYGGTISNNAYYNAGWKYKGANYATQYQTLAGEHRWLTAGVGGAAGNAITFTQAMTLFSDGNLALNTTTNAGYKLDVNGTGRFTGSIYLTQSTYTMPALTPSSFGYSSSYNVVILGNSSGAQSRSLAFNVDVSGNPSGSFNGYGSEYIWRNAGSFITPNSSNNGYNTLLSWNSSGQLTVPQAATFSSSVTVGTDVTLNNGVLYVSAGSGTGYSSRLSTVYNYPYVETYLDSYAGASYEGRLLFRTNSGGGAMSTQLTITNSNGATFSSSVTVNGVINFPNGSISSYGELAFNSSSLNIYTYGRIGLSNLGRIIFNNGTGANLFFGELATNIYGFTAGSYNSTPGLTMDMINYRVGIGTTSPNYKLDVNGDINIPGTNKLVFNNEPNSWFLQARTTTSTANLGSGLKNLFYNGGGSNEGIAFSGVGTGAASLEVRNDGRVWVKENLIVGGTINVTNTINVSGGSAGGFTNGTISWISGTGGGLSLDSPGCNLKLGTGWNEKLISNTGSGFEVYTNNGSGSYNLKFNIDRSGNATLAGTFTESSSIRYKDNIETVKDGLDIILSLRGVTYNKKQTGSKELGLIAEEVESVLPDVVIKDAEGKPDSVAYARIVAVLVEAVKELKQEINVLNGKLNS